MAELRKDAPGQDASAVSAWGAGNGGPRAAGARRGRGLEVTQQRCVVISSDAAKARFGVRNLDQALAHPDDVCDAHPVDPLKRGL
jgi:hypothetical protein